MKKLLSLLLALCLAAVLVPAAAEEDLIGTWNLVRATAQGVEMIVIGDEIAITMTIREDGTASLYSLLPGEEPATAENNWSYADGVLTLTNPESGEVEMIAPIVNGEITVEAGGAEMVLSREPHAVYEMPAAVKADSLSAFNGVWCPDISFPSGMMARVPLSMEERAHMEIRNGSVVETESSGEVTQYEGAALDTESGSMKALLSLAGMGYEGYYADVELTLLEDGTMHVYISFAGYEVTSAIYIKAAD